MSRKPSRPGEVGSVPAIPRLNLHDGLLLTLITTVRLYGVAFFQSAQSRNGSLASFQHSPPKDPAWQEKSKDISVTFKLAIDLLNRGHSKLAGRMARKAFLLSESILALESTLCA